MEPHEYGWRIKRLEGFLIDDMQVDKLSVRERATFLGLMDYWLGALRNRRSWKTRTPWIMAGIMFVGAILGGLVSNLTIHH